MHLHFSPRIVGLALALALLWPAAPASAALSHDDRIASLWSGRFSFTDHGTPMARIGIITGANSVSISGRAGASVRLWPSSPEGESEVLAGAGWTVTAVEAHPPQLQWMVVLERVAGSDGSDALGKRLAAWRARGVDPVVVETGTVFGVRGTLLDTRTHLIALSGHPSRERALVVADEARRRFAVDAGLHAHVERPATGTLEVTSADGAVRVTVADAVWFGGNADEDQLMVSAPGREARRYRGGIYVTVGADGRLVAVNTVDAEEMLFGLVPAETYPSAAVDALKAQAVTARGHLLSKIGHVHGGDPFLLCAQTHCQVYAGASAEVARVSKAVAATRGDLLFGGGALVPSHYAASCGGYSENCETVWDRSPSRWLRAAWDGPDTVAGPLAALDPIAVLRRGLTEESLRAMLTSRPAAWCSRSSFSKSTFRWETTRSAATVSKMVAAKYPGVGRVKELRVAGRGPGGRLEALEVVGDRGSATVHRELAVRRLLGNLKSGLFVLDVARDTAGNARSFTFHGGGFGHGVGLCQLGAIGMADAGIDYRRILAHYYGGAAVKTLY